MTFCLPHSRSRRTLKLSYMSNGASMHTALLSSKKNDECVRRVEVQDEHLQHLRFKVEVHATRMREASGSEREQAYQLYKQAMRRLLSYLSTHFIVE